MLKKALGICGFEVVNHSLIGEVRPEPVVEYVLHVLSSLGVQGLQQGIGPAVEFGGEDVELLAQLNIEGGRGFDPLAVEIEQSVAVVDEDIGSAHTAPQSFGTEVVHDVRQTDRGVYSQGPGRGGQEIGFGDAETGPDRQDIARFVDSPVQTDAVRIVADGVSDPVKQPDSALDVVSSSPGSVLSKLPDL